ncbi:MAG: malic enzyme-like NAD(P)-binding protein [Synergistota bacterium]|nr:malic enzyme-like NAD(P)-binding protein [Synergistota bacterium]
MTDVYRRSLELHRESRGKIELSGKVPLSSMADLALAYTPGVAEPCREIIRDRETVYEVTAKGNMVAVVTDGSAVLGLGDIGPEAALPVMEGKAVLFKRFAGIDAFPVCIASRDTDEIVRVVSLITPSFGGINLEDISSPRCFEIERRLQEACDIPVFHDDQHGTAVIVLAGLLNALKVVGKRLEDVKTVISGAGAAGIAICRFLMSAGASNVILCDRAGAVYKGRPEGMNPAKIEIAELSNPDDERGCLRDVLRGADVYLGLSAPGVVDREAVASMSGGAVVFAMANPTPEIYPEEALAAGAAVVATGRSDFPNQINNCLGFPGIFRGALDVRASTINEEMKLAASYSLASLVTDSELRPDRIITEIMDERVVPAMAAAVSEAARRTRVARV